MNDFNTDFVPLTNEQVIRLLPQLPTPLLKNLGATALHTSILHRRGINVAEAAFYSPSKHPVPGFLGSYQVQKGTARTSTLL